MEHTLPRLSVAVATHNSASHIAQLIEYAVSLKPDHLYVLDDASTDDTVSICQQYQDVEIVAGTKNLGPTGNRNRALTKDLGDIVLFLDDDMRWRAGSVKAALATYFADPTLGALGFAIYDTKGKQLWFRNEHESNPLFSWTQTPFITRLQPHERQQSFVPVQWVLEGAFAVRSELFKKLHGFDPRFKRYQEGPDLCRRIRKLGYTIGHTHDAQFTHSRPLSVYTLGHAARYFRSGVVWYALHRGKVKPGIKKR